jgi:hypothetical protein
MSLALGLMLYTLECPLATFIKNFLTAFYISLVIALNVQRARHPDVIRNYALSMHNPLISSPSHLPSTQPPAFWTSQAGDVSRNRGLAMRSFEIGIIEPGLITLSVHTSSLLCHSSATNKLSPRNSQLVLFLARPSSS